MENKSSKESFISTGVFTKLHMCVTVSGGTMLLMSYSESLVLPLLCSGGAVAVYVAHYDGKAPAGPPHPPARLCFCCFCQSVRCASAALAPPSSPRRPRQQLYLTQCTEMSVQAAPRPAGVHTPS